MPCLGHVRIIILTLMLYLFIGYCQCQYCQVWLMKTGLRAVIYLAINSMREMSSVTMETKSFALQG
jgi:hypothetical protein